jgi:hypothetical protein
MKGYVLLVLIVFFLKVSEMRALHYIGMNSGGGCTESTASQSFLREFVTRHGSIVCRSILEAFHGKESYVDFAQFKEAEKSCLRSNATVMTYKSPSYQVPAISSYLKARDAQEWHLQRENVIDREICKVRDCFDSTHGFQCNANGTRTTTCFGRRSDEKQKYYACLSIESAIHKMTSEYRANDKYSEELGVFKSNELLSFQYAGPENRATSIKSWVRLMTFLGIETNETKIESIIDDMKKEGFWKDRVLTTHESVVYNYEEFAKAIVASRDKRLNVYLRNPLEKEETKVIKV